MPAVSSRAFGLARAEADAKGLRLCFALRASVFVRGVCAPQCPLSSVMVCDNDGATFLAVPVSDDGTARVDFSLQPSVRVRHAEPGVTDRLKFHFRARDSPTHEFGVCSGHFYLRELLAQAATGQRVPKAQSDTVRTRMARAAKGRVFVVSDNFQPVEVHFTVSGGSADAVARFDALYEAGAIRDSVLWQSEKMNALVETQVGLLADMLQQHTVVSLERGLSPFLNMGTCHPMEGERLLFPDISKNMEYMRAEFAPAGATAYLIVMAFNCNAVHVEDAYHMNDHNLAHMLACTTAGTFTKDGLAAGYVTDVNVSGAALTYNAMLCAAFAATTATENMPRGLGGPNVGPVVFSSGDCEDHSRTIEAVLKGCIELHERGLGGAGALPFLAQLAPATLEAVLYCAGRFHAMLAPFRARLGPLAAGAKAKAAEPSVLVDVTNVLGTALAPSAGGEIAGGGELAGHSYMHMELRHADGRAENLVLEGTTPLSNVEAAPRERSMPVLHTVPREAAERFVACNGGRVLAATADSVTLELDVPVTALLQAVEAEPFMAVDPKMCRRDVPCFSVSHRSARSHVHELGGSLLPSLVPKKLREAAKKVWDRFAHGKRSKCAHTACEEQEVEETEDEPAENRARSFYQDAVVMGDRLVTEVVGGEERLGSFFSSYYPGKPGVSLRPITQLAGMPPADFAAVEKYKLDRLCEIYEPLCVPELDAQIGAVWKPIQCVAEKRGAAVNAFLDSVYCVTVSESALGRPAQAAQEQKARELAAQANAYMATQNLPHRMLCHDGIHSALRTFVLHKPAVQQQHGARLAAQRKAARASRKVRPL